MKEIFGVCAIIAVAISYSTAGDWIVSEDLHLYFIELRQGYNWFQALNECIRINMSLVTIEAPSKHRDIYNVLAVLYSVSELPRFWIGGHDNVIPDRFEWFATGERFLYSNWAAGEPSGSRHSEHCVATWSNDLAWNDAPCSLELGFICEENQTVQQTNDKFVLKKSVEAQRVTDKIQELEDLKARCSKQSRQMEEKQKEYTSLQTNALNLYQALMEKNEELTILKELTQVQAMELQTKEEELNMFKSAKNGFLATFVKSNEKPGNRTAGNRFYNIIVNANRN